MGDDGDTDFAYLGGTPVKIEATNGAKVNVYINIIRNDDEVMVEKIVERVWEKL